MVRVSITNVTVSACLTISSGAVNRGRHSRRPVECGTLTPRLNSGKSTRTVPVLSTLTTAPTALHPFASFCFAQSRSLPRGCQVFIASQSPLPAGLFQSGSIRLSVAWVLSKRFFLFGCQWMCFHFNAESTADSSRTACFSVFESSRCQVWLTARVV